MFLLISGGHIGAPKQYGVSIQSSTKVHETFRQITQKLWATKTRDLEKLFIYYNFIFFASSNMFFLLCDSENDLLHDLWFNLVSLFSIFEDKSIYNQSYTSQIAITFNPEIKIILQYYTDVSRLAFPWQYYCPFNFKAGVNVNLNEI